MKPTLLALAAGMGSRYGGLKQLEPVGPGGEAFVDYSVYDALRAGFGKVVFVLRRDIERDFREAVGRRFESRLPVEYAFQESAPGRAKPWGTGHAVLSGADAVREPFAVINADDFYGRRSFEAVGAHLRQAGDWAMVAFALRSTLSPHGAVSRGVCAVDEAGYLSGVVEHEKVSAGAPGLTGDEPVSMNMWGFTPALFGELGRMFEEFRAARAGDPKAEFYIPSAVASLIAGGRAKVRVLRSPEPCFGVTYKEDLESARASILALIRRGEYPERLWA